MLENNKKELFETIGKITEYIDEMNERIKKENEKNDKVGG